MPVGGQSENNGSEEAEVTDFDVDEALDQSQVVVRVRRDSEDSLGSEISCSPPSSPRTASEGMAGDTR